MFSNDFRIKDTIKVGDSKGKILDFTFTNVQIKNEFGDIIYIPNSVFLSKEITNYSRSSLKNISIDIMIPKEDLIKFEKQKNNIINRLFKQYEEYIQDKNNINLSLNKLEKETITILFEIYLPRYSSTIEKSIKSEIIKNLGQINKSKKK